MKRLCRGSIKTTEKLIDEIGRAIDRSNLDRDTCASILLGLATEYVSPGTFSFPPADPQPLEVNRGSH